MPILQSVYHFWRPFGQAKLAAREHANALRTRISFRARLSREFSRSPKWRTCSQARKQGVRLYLKSYRPILIVPVVAKGFGRIISTNFIVILLKIALFWVVNQFSDLVLLLLLLCFKLQTIAYTNIDQGNVNRFVIKILSKVLIPLITIFSYRS